MASGQINYTDSKGKDIFTVYQTKSLSFPISPAATEFKATLTTRLTEGIQYYLPSGPNDFLVEDTSNGGFKYRTQDSSKFTVAKSWGAIMSLKTGGITNVLSNSSAFNPTYGLALGISNNIDVFNNWDNIRRLNQLFIRTFSLTAFVNRDNVKIYDTLKRAGSRQRPVSAGLTFDHTVFSKKLLPGKWILAISFSATAEYGWNTADLVKYQDNKPIYTDPNAVSLGDVAGRIGNLDRQNNFRFRLSVPVFVPAIDLPVIDTALQLTVIPYYASFGKADASFSRQTGVFLNISPGRFYTRDAKLVSGVGIGIDWIRTKEKWSGRNVYVAGTLNIQELFPHKDEAAEKIR